MEKMPMIRTRAEQERIEALGEKTKADIMLDGAVIWMRHSLGIENKINLMIQMAFDYDGTGINGAAQ